MSRESASFADSLRRLRLAAGLSQMELADLAGVSLRGVSDLERGVRRAPHLTTVRRLADALALDAAERQALLTAARPGSVPEVQAGALADSAALPAPLTPLVGRERELAALVSLLGDAEIRLVTLTGAGGIGKTRLAIAGAARLAEDFPDGVRFVGLAPVTDPTLVVPSVAQVLGVREAGREPLADRLKAFLREKRLLLVLDNFEQVVEAAPLVTDLLGACSALKVLVTSRVRLRVSGEHEYVVPPLGLAQPDAPTTSDGVQSSEAVRLFVARAQAVREDFALTAENAAAVARICQRLDGLPLAIELAAPRIKVLPPPALLARLEPRLPLLTGGGRDAPARQRTMRDAIAWSYDLLPAPEQALFRRLAIFVGGCTLEAAEAVTNPTGDLEIDVLDGVTSLVDKSLLREAEGRDGEPRYLMLETVREFGLERLLESGEAEVVAQQHADHFVAFAETVAAPVLEVSDPAMAFTRVDAEQGNLRAALTWVVERGEVAALLRLVEALRSYWTMLGRMTEGQAWAERAVTVCDAVPASQRATALWETGWFARQLGNHHRAKEVARESLALARGVGDDLAIAKAQYLLGWVAEDQGDLALARALHEAALRLLLPMNVPYWTAHSLYHVGRLSGICGDFAVAERHLEEALARCRQEGHRYGPALVQSGMAIIALKRGEYARAAALWQERLGLAWDAFGLRSCLEGLAEIAVACGEHERAARLLGAADAVRERLSIARVPGLLPQYEKAVAATKSALGEVTFVAAWDEGRRLSPDQARAEAALVAGEVPGARRANASTAVRQRLTPRELDVLRLVAQGRSNREIADALFISVPTVKRHLSTVLGKLALPSRSAATAYAHTHDLI